MEVLAVDLTQTLSNALHITYAALGLGLVIFLHELGHFAVAKWCDVYVERFSIGFGPVFFSRKWGETEYALSLIPFGGYVKMLGQDDADPSQLTSEEIAADPRSYVAKSVLQRMAIISAGVTMNVLTAFLFFIVVFSVGFPTSPSRIGDVRPGMPAWEAGISAGDLVEKINDTKISTFTDVQMSVALSSGPLKLDEKYVPAWLRDLLSFLLSSGPLRLEGQHADGTPFDITVDPDASRSHPQIGVAPTESLTVYDTILGRRSADDGPTFLKGDRVKMVGGREVKTAVEFHRAVAANTDNPLEITVDRSVKQSGKEVSTTETIGIKDNYFRTLGLILDSGPIVAVRKGSPAEKAGLKKGDKLANLDGLNIGTEIDPLKLPVEFASRGKEGKEITVTVTRQPVGGGREKVTVNLVPDDIPGWLDQPELPGEPLSIPSIGVAFHILPFVLAVTPDGPAEKAGVKPGPLKRMTLSKRPELKNYSDEIKETAKVIQFDDEHPNNCAHAFWLMQLFPQRKVVLTFGDDANPVEIVPELDRNWCLPIVGIRFEPERQMEKADSFGEACAMSIKHTRRSALNIYLTLRSLVTGRVSYKELHGPIGIAQTAFQFAPAGLGGNAVVSGFPKREPGGP